MLKTRVSITDDTLMIHTQTELSSEILTKPSKRISSPFQRLPLEDRNHTAALLKI